MVEPGGGLHAARGTEPIARMTSSTLTSFVLSRPDRADSMAVRMNTDTAIPGGRGRVFQALVKVNRQPQGAQHVQGCVRLTGWRQQRQQFSLLLRCSRQGTQVFNRLVNLFGTGLW